jgi:hypothetical protein
MAVVRKEEPVEDLVDGQSVASDVIKNSPVALRNAAS